MSFSQPTGTQLFGVAFAVSVSFVACQWWVNASDSTSASADFIPARVPAPPPGDRLERSRLHAVGIDDGEVPDGVTVFDDDYPAVSNLDGDLLDALRNAANDSGIRFEVSSGWRSDAYQRQVFEQAVAKYGTEAGAARWAARPGTSVHEHGEAVDISNPAATAWLSRHGDSYGLCQIYANEPWHYELRPDAEDDGCPDVYADASHDPRMQ